MKVPFGFAGRAAIRRTVALASLLTRKMAKPHRALKANAENLGPATPQTEPFDETANGTAERPTGLAQNDSPHNRSDARAPNELSPLLGWVDWFEPPNIVHGRAYAGEDQAIEIVAILQGKDIGRAQADGLRADIQALRGGQVGFRLELSQPFDVGRLSELEFRAEGQGHSLGQVRPVPELSAAIERGSETILLRGCVDGCDFPNWISGWTALLGRNDHLMVSVRLGDREIGSAVADVRRDDLTNSSDKRHGFKVRLSGLATPEDMQSLNVVAQLDGRDIGTVDIANWIKHQKVEPVRLVIWDLDETFWKGTLTEGGIDFVAAHKQIVITLAERGIVSSICSKNNFKDAETILVEHKVWDYFILPSISWEPKGPRIQALIDTIGLRAANVMFIDDNPLNLEEARRFCPDLQIRTRDFIRNILSDPLFRGKDDQCLTRLKQYKVLEQKKTDQSSAGANIDQFLRDSDIRVTFDFDVTGNINRFIELINRTNQLNFTKRRLPENLEDARKEVHGIINSYARQAALIRVSDKYGDHGYCGAYVHNSEARRLEHFAFSCRILGMGVERWLYRKLNNPGIQVQGEVLADLFDPAPIDWIRQARAEDEATVADNAPKLDRITARGSCDIGAIIHYFRFNSEDVVGEYHIFRNGGVFRIEHTVFLLYAAEGITPMQAEAAKRLGFIETDFTSRIYESTAGAEKQTIILGFGADLTQPLYRHRASGLLLPFAVIINGWIDRDIRQIPDDAVPHDVPGWMRDALQSLRTEWDYLGRISPQDFEHNLFAAVTRIPANVSIHLLGYLDREYVDTRGNVDPFSPHMMAYNDAMRNIADSFDNVTWIDINPIVQDQEIFDRLHFARSTLFRIYQAISKNIFAGEPTSIAVS